MENKNSDNIHRQTSRSTAAFDAVECLVNTSDLSYENEALNREQERQRQSNSSRRDSTIKRSNENLAHRSARHSPSSNVRKRHSSPRSGSSSSRSHQQHHHHHPPPPPQRYHRVSSPSPSPPPPPSSSSRHHRSVAAVKRPHSRSPYERRPPTYRSRHETSNELNTNDVLQRISSADEQSKSKTKTSGHETTDLSFVSEDELTKSQDTRTNNTATIESSSAKTDTKLHSTPSVPVLQQNSNESLLEMSNITQEYDISLFAKSSLSTPTINPISRTPNLPISDFMQTIDLINKYKTMHATPSNDPQIEACSKEILTLIQKQIELQKIELNYREREIKLRERELVEREKRFNEQSNDTTSMTAVNSEPPVVGKSTISEENPQQKTTIILDQDMKDVSEEESTENPISSTADTTKVTIMNKNGSDQPTFIRKKTGKSRFSPTIVVPSTLDAQENATIELYSDDHDQMPSSLSINANSSLKKPTISKILAPTESIISLVDTDLKVTSSNSCRKVEFQSGSIDKATTSKGSSHDLRLTLCKNRTKHQSSRDDNGSMSNQLNSDDESNVTSNKAMSSKVHTIKDDKQQSHDYQQQPRSVTSASIEVIVDDTNGKRDNRRHQQRVNSSRQPQYVAQNSASSNSSSKERPFNYESPTQSSSKYGSSQKRQETDDLRSHLHKQQPTKSSRATHRSNY
ncbi:unnamed protein product [Rotaria magnacalcarata]|uniref:Uncharacterized protein n=6 Tax=Rotaria magnacalcarata TaxID=392030 RepID=A0A814XKB8_9BILA|nr:unnamed protein product [Rotaria magnacalcarata]CAF1245132.1 unnamed protein product [Rotaria magnacalcarata]